MPPVEVHTMRIAWKKHHENIYQFKFKFFRPRKTSEQNIYPESFAIIQYLTNEKFNSKGHRSQLFIYILVAKKSCLSNKTSHLIVLCSINFVNKCLKLINNILIENQYKLNLQAQHDHRNIPATTATINLHYGDFILPLDL